MYFEWFTVVAEGGPVTWAGISPTSYHHGRVHSFECYANAKAYRTFLRDNNPNQKFFIVHTVIDGGNVFSEIKSNAEEDL